MEKQVAVALALGVSGCASVAAPGVEEMRPDPRPAPSFVAAKPRSDAEAVLASIPTSGDARAQRGDGGSEILVTAPRDQGSPLREERLVGSNEQPEWTTQRRWAKTRAYVIAPGQIEFEQWYKLQTPRGSGPVHRWQSEIGFGFEGGWQLDLYENYGREPDGPTKHEGVQVEGRYALGKWGEIPANPTLYLEYVANYRAADKVEAKLLLADELGGGWHWASNLVYEQETSGVRETELALSGGLSYALLDSRFSVGVEANAERVTGKGFRSSHAASNEFLVGPAFQWRPTENCHIDFSPLMGLTKGDRRDPRYEVWLIFGWDFGPEQAGHRDGPASTRGR
jgi:hypothetical protein